MRQLQIGQARYAFAAPTHHLSIALEQVIGQTHLTKRREPRKGIEADACLQHLKRSCGLACMDQGLGVSMVDVIGIERKGALEFGDGGIVPVLVKQDVSKLGASLRQAGVEVRRHRGQFKGAIERGGIEIVAIEWFEISVEVSPGQYRSGACITRVDRERLFEQTPCVIERRFRASAL